MANFLWTFFDENGLNNSIPAGVTESKIKWLKSPKNIGKKIKTKLLVKGPKIFICKLFEEKELNNIGWNVWDNVFIDIVGRKVNNKIIANEKIIIKGIQSFLFKIIIANPIIIIAKAKNWELAIENELNIDSSIAEVEITIKNINMERTVIPSNEWVKPLWLEK